jgi:predicted amidohydrolase YtcJ
MTASSQKFPLVLLAACVVLAGCSSGPSGPTAGSPAFYWSAAQQTFRNGDHVKTSDHLSKAMKSAEYAAKAQPWEMVVNSGLAQGYMELADRYETGARATRGAVPGFRTQVSHLRSLANAAVLQFTESMHAFTDKNKEETIVLAFPFPSGTTAEPVQLAKVSKGVMPAEAEVASLEKAMLQRGVLLAVANAAGSPNDTAKARERLKEGELKLPRQEFLRAMARALYEDALLYVPSKMDHPQRMKLVCREAKEALDQVKQANKEDVALRKKIDEAIKKYKLS